MNYGGTDYIIRKAANSDFDAVYRLICELTGAQLGVLPVKPTEAAYTANIADSEKLCYVAEISGMVVGFIGVSMEPRLYAAGKIATVAEMIVQDEYSDQGIGTLLLKQVIASARDAGCAEMEVASNLNRLRAHHFYEKNGFVKDGYRFGLHDI